MIDLVSLFAVGLKNTVLGYQTIVLLHVVLSLVLQRLVGKFGFLRLGILPWVSQARKCETSMKDEKFRPTGYSHVEDQSND